MVVVWFGRSQRHHARVDFVPPFDDRLVRVEVDEHQHIDYDQRKDLEHTWRLFETCPQPLHLIRLNPDLFIVTGRLRRTFWSQCAELLLEAIQTNVWGIAYLCHGGALKATVPLIMILVLGLPWSVDLVHWSRDHRRAPRTLETCASARSSLA